MGACLNLTINNLTNEVKVGQFVLRNKKETMQLSENASLTFQNDFDKVLNPGAWDPNLLLGITLAVSTTAVLVLSALGLMLVKRRRKQMRLKQNQIEQEEEDSRLRDQYSVSNRKLGFSRKRKLLVYL